MFPDVRQRGNKSVGLRSSVTQFKGNSFFFVFQLMLTKIQY